jgi:molybdopterin/thiamine biosynthesis adenylyltransferase
MRYTLTFPEGEYASLVAHLFSDRSVERAAFLRCGISTSSLETRLLVRNVAPVAPADVLDASASHMRIAPHAYLRAMKDSHLDRSAFVFVHSHPARFERHSPQDDQEERKLFRTAHVRIGGATVHASLVLSDPAKPIGRVWLADGTTAPIERIRVIGNRFRFYDDAGGSRPTPEFFDRQVRAFGKEIQLLLSRLTVGVVGCGGTGSAVIEQLVRLGVGRIIVFDGEVFEKSNVNRVFGSSSDDAGVPKTDIAVRSTRHVNVGTEIVAITMPITFRSAIERLKECDVAFGCTDEEWGRSLLTKFALYYVVPVFDIAVKIDSEEGVIRSVQGRVTSLLPGAACLYCRKRIDPKRVYYETVQATSPAEAENLRREGYVPELGDPAPAVITFTSSVAAGAINELLHRVTGFMGDERRSTEVIYRFDDSALSTNARPPEIDCVCSTKKVWGRGDRSPLLDVVWRAEPDVSIR